MNKSKTERRGEEKEKKEERKGVLDCKTKIASFVALYCLMA